MGDLKKELKEKANKKKAKILQRFFKTGKGEYGEGDLFLGVVVPEQRKIAAKYKHLGFLDLGKCISSKFHEERLTTLLILVLKFKKAGETEKKQIFNFYIKNRKYINNWDLVDLTAPNIAGAYLENKDKFLLYKFARSKDIWERRIAMLSCFHYIRKGSFQDALKIAEILKNDEHDLIQKAVGWMLREAGKRCGQKIEEEFLKKYHNPDAQRGRGSDLPTIRRGKPTGRRLQKRRRTLPRTMLRYAIEKFPEKERKLWLG